MFTGKSLKDMSAALTADPSLRPFVVATLEVRKEHDSASGRRAAAALARLNQGLPLLAEKTPRTETAQVSAPAAALPTGVPAASDLIAQVTAAVLTALGQPAAPAAPVAAPAPAPVKTAPAPKQSAPRTKRTGSVVTVAEAIATGKANGQSIPRWLSAINAGRPCPKKG